MAAPDLADPILQPVSPRPAVSLLAQISLAHGVSHLHIMALPALLPILPALMGVSYVELGLALSIFNIVSALAQAPLGFAVDRIGPRRVLMAGLLLGSFSFVSLAVVPRYEWLLVAMALAGLANGVYHPADYALLSKGIAPARMGRAFSVHTFAGYFGGAIAPGLLIGLSLMSHARVAFAATAAAGFLAALVLWLPTAAAKGVAGAPGPDAATVPTAGRGADASAGSGTPPQHGAATPPAGGQGRVGPIGVFTPAVFGLTLLYVLLSLSNGSIERFSVPALVSGYGVELPLAGTAVSAFLFASAFGVLAGGALADRTRRHGWVAAIAFAGAAVLVAVVAQGGLPPVLLVGLLGMAGFLTGIIAPSRDMLVRAAAPPGSEGRVFGIVSTGFNIGGAVGPLLFGWLLDQGRYSGIFWSAVLFMVLTVALVLVQERRAARRRARSG